MENKKQSSIEWLQATELQRDLTLGNWKKAKAMQKEEIENMEKKKKQEKKRERDRA